MPVETQVQDTDNNLQDIDTSSLNDDRETEDPATLRAWGFSEDEIAQLRGESPAPAPEEKPVVETPAPVVVDDAPKDDIEELKKLADFGKQWQEAFTKDPQGTVAQLLASQAFTPETRAAVIAKAGGTPPVASSSQSFDPAKYEPQSDFEKAALPEMEWVRSGRQAVTQALEARDKDIQHTYIHAKALESKIDALAEVLGIGLPSLDTKGVFKHYNETPGVTLDDAIKTVMGKALADIVKVEKQKRVERPDTLKNEGAKKVEYKTPKDINEMYALAGLMLED